MIKVAPSILSADFNRLQHQLKIAEQAGADWIHVDVMDGQFVPNLTFGPKIVEWVNRLTTLPLDVHLMVNEPDVLIPAFVKAGADRLTVHIEAIKHIHRTLKMIKDHGISAGITLNPGTSARAIEAVIPEVDLVLVMSVNPGFGGQAFIESSLSKIKYIFKMIKTIKPDVYLEVDGGIDMKTAPLVVEAGANVLVAGSFIFSSDDIKKSIHLLKNHD
ncbi:ribulose-phosphate 3-epimerase [candidate division KSB1 bacterium]|nr:ribulose-phosphate 3-epimerase [candidate division KSB1 bacterium]